MQMNEQLMKQDYLKIFFLISMGCIGILYVFLPIIIFSLIFPNTTSPVINGIMLIIEFIWLIGTIIIVIIWDEYKIRGIKK